MMRAAALAVLVLLAGCASLAPEVQVETHTVTNVVRVPVPVLCFNPEDLPALPARTPVDVEHATTDQLAAAAAADAEAFEMYARQVARLWAQCLKSVPVEAK